MAGQASCCYGAGRPKAIPFFLLLPAVCPDFLSAATAAVADDGVTAQAHAHVWFE
jgi:hypothetical protein